MLLSSSPQRSVRRAGSHCWLWRLRNYVIADHVCLCVCVCVRLCARDERVRAYIVLRARARVFVCVCVCVRPARALSMRVPVVLATLQRARVAGYKVVLPRARGHFSAQSFRLARCMHTPALRDYFGFFSPLSFPEHFPLFFLTTRSLVVRIPPVTRYRYYYYFLKTRRYKFV